jgi:hypothetical protein
VKKAITRGECIFVTGFCEQYIMDVLYPKLFFCTDEAWFHLSVSALKVTDVKSVLIHNRHFKCPFTIRRWVCDVPLLLHEQQDPLKKNTINSKWYVSYILQLSLGARQNVFK